MSTDDFVNLLDEIKCELALLNENLERYFRLTDPDFVSRRDT